MPISSEDFDKSMPSSPLLQFLKAHPDKAFSLAELCGKFGGQSYNELQFFVSKNEIEVKNIPNPKTRINEPYYRIKKSFRVRRP